MAKFNVSGVVTLSVGITVEADNEEQAIHRANRKFSLMTLHFALWPCAV
jgi:hypothetical protein